MQQPRTIALDGMGGDHGPAVVLGGAAISLERHPNLSFIVTGKQAEAYKFAKQRAEALKKELGINQEVFIRIGGTVGQIVGVSRHDSLEDVVKTKQKVIKATLEGKLPTAPAGGFAKVSEALWTEP